MAHAPENTFASFERALELGADVIELDVHLSRDGEVVVIHDEQLERTTDGTGLVGEATLSELKRLDAGSWFSPRFAGERIPSLEEVLTLASSDGRSPRLAIEIKNAPIFYRGIEAKILALLVRRQMHDRVLIISFDHHAIRRFVDLEPRVSTGVLYACRPLDPVGMATAAGAEVLEPHWSFVTPEDVKAAHQAGLRVSAWATSDPTQLRSLLDAGVDGIATNNPETLVRILSEGRPHPSPFPGGEGVGSS